MPEAVIDVLRPIVLPKMVDDGGSDERCRLCGRFN
jgi:hypothetical protein